MIAHRVTSELIYLSVAFAEEVESFTEHMRAAASRPNSFDVTRVLIRHLNTRWKVEVVMVNVVVGTHLR